jgi:hypothetical protein
MARPSLTATAQHQQVDQLVSRIRGVLADAVMGAL